MSDVAEGRRGELAAQVSALIARLADGSRDDDARDRLLERVLAWQREQVQAYGRIVAHATASAQPGSMASGSDSDSDSDSHSDSHSVSVSHSHSGSVSDSHSDSVSDSDSHSDSHSAVDLRLLDAPAVPTDVFRFTRVAAHPQALDTRVFRTSGTTGQSRGAHHLRELSLYEQAAEAAARYALFPDLHAGESMALCVLAPRDGVAGDSSLSFMLSKFDEWFARRQAVFAWHGDGQRGELDLDALVMALARAQHSGEPLALLGTSFAFVHAEDALERKRFALPVGSRVMQTGGFKGRSREVDPQAMRALLTARYGIEDPWIVAEYGMTELSSQMYENTLRAVALGHAPGSRQPRQLWVPGWVRATPVDPVTLREVPAGEVGILRIDDPANLDSACAIQTSDRARRVGDGIEVLGRAPGATARGCSIAVDAALGG